MPSIQVCSLSAHYLLIIRSLFIPYLLTLWSDMCETTSIDLSYNLVYEPEVHKFAQKLSEVSFEEFLADPVKDAAQMGEITSTRNQVAFMVSDLVEHESCKIQKLVLAGDPELELTASNQEIQRCLAFGIQLALPLTSLSRNSTITHLDISGNLIGDHGASALAHATPDTYN